MGQLQCTALAEVPSNGQGLHVQSAQLQLAGWATVAVGGSCDCDVCCTDALVKSSSDDDNNSQCFIPILVEY